MTARTRIRNLFVLQVMVTPWLKTTPAVATPHDEGTLKLADRRLAAGMTILLAGEKFNKQTTLTLALVGLSGRFEIGRVKTDTAGRFTESLQIPADLEPGSFRLVAIATDRDEVASLRVEVLARAGPMPEKSPAPVIAEPSPKPLALERARNPLVTGGAVLAVVLALAFGIILLRQPRRLRY